ncbi:hypothetical protein C5167_024762 [Papaver somniferum]|uniref:Uncharacterized protein n=1 Tax=Papaver somniferum TaxID=3469 RepID=A0A4Y7JQJ4_PAPSO|nr:hypothetical protein C5167_024762 [Papaver somniferum]
MGKISMFVSFFLFVLIAMPAASSTSSRTMLEKDARTERCPNTPSCDDNVEQCEEPTNCPRIRCRQGLVLYRECCECPKCCSRR